MSTEKCPPEIAAVLLRILAYGIVRIRMLGWNKDAEEGRPMKSPFPGMDPYLEQRWRDVHHNIITFAQGALNEALPDGLIARVEERVFLEPEWGPGRSPYPDLRVVERKPPAP